MTISPPAAAWSLARQRASCSVGGLASAIDLAHPQRGLEVMLPGATVPDRLLGIELEPDCGYTDAWCRGADLTAVYETRAGGRLRATAMWRAQPAWLDASTDVWCREAIVSAQTALLEDAPRVSVGADLAGSRIERVLAAIGVCGAYMLFDLTCQNLGYNGYIHPVVAAWSPTILFGSLGAVLFSGVKS